jgi:soluble lytic murein transglycosylase
MKRFRRVWLPALLILVGACWFFWWHSRRLEHSQDGPIREAAARYNVDPALVKAIVWRESRFNPRAFGRAEEIGLMQIREEAAREWADAERISGFAHEQCYDPRTNTLAGTWYLKKMLKRYTQTDDPVPFALADYNAGRGNVLKWMKGAGLTNSATFLDQVGFPGTRDYIRGVMERQRHYRPEFGPPPARP